MGNIRWGIMGTGGIAAAMAETLRDVDAPITVVGSSRDDAAEAFADRWAIPHSVPSHRGVAERDDVDIVYVATTNDRHHRNVLDCVASGQAVMCEKPVALNAAQAREMFDAAASAGVFLMEALWMRFFPFMAKLDELISEGAIGTITDVQATFMYPASREADRRWMNRALGGGALLDLGIYTLSFVHHLLGPPVSFESQSHLTDTGVDLATHVISRHDGGASASITCGFNADTANEAIVAGTEGRIRVHAGFHRSTYLTVERGEKVLASHDVGFTGLGYRFEVAEAQRCFAAGMTESPMRPHADTLAIMEWMDAIRARGGIAYDADVG